MVGRAGRAGLTESGDSVLLCQEKDKTKVIILQIFYYIDDIFGFQCIIINNKPNLSKGYNSISLIIYNLILD